MNDSRVVRTGVAGLDDVLRGGLLPERAYMLRGGPGTGKTILGLTFLAEGAAEDETGLCINFEEPPEDLRANVEGLGIDLADVEFLDLSPEAAEFAEDRSYDVFHPEEVESESVTTRITEAVEAVDPDRVFVDPMTHLQYLLSGEYQFRTQVASFMRYLTDRGATVLFATQPTESMSDDDLQFIADGALELDYAPKGRTIEVQKFRGSGFQSGEHTVRIDDDGFHVYPKLVPEAYSREFVDEQLSTGIDELDDLLHGGIERGTVTVLAGPSGVGKTTTGTHLLEAAAERGERAVAYLFEEGLDTLRHRSTSIGIPVDEMVDQGNLVLETVEPLSLSPDEFAAKVREEVEERDASVVMIDGITGYRLSVRGDSDDLVRELHSLGRYLKNMGVTVLLIGETKSVTGDFRITEENISYLGDNVLFLRYIEVEGEMRKAVGVLKKRASDFERTLRRFEVTGDGVVLGESLRNLRGVLTGTPEFVPGDDG